VINAVIPEAPLQAVFTVTLNPASDSTVLVSFATADGTALAGGDYIASSQMVTFLPGEIEHKVTVLLIAQPLTHISHSLA